MRTFREGSLEITVPEDISCRKFDGDGHGLSHCMKAVDFIIEESERTIFIEIKDPDNPNATDDSRKKFIEQFTDGRTDDALVRKFRDSFLYLWAEDRISTTVDYYVLIASDRLDDAMLQIRTEELKRKLPLHGSRTWKRQIVNHCAVFNLKSWNAHLHQLRYPVRRTHVP